MLTVLPAHICQFVCPLSCTLQLAGVFDGHVLHLHTAHLQVLLTAVQVRCTTAGRSGGGVWEELWEGRVLDRQIANRC